MIDSKIEIIKKNVDKRYNTLISNLSSSTYQHLGAKESQFNLEIQNTYNFLKNYNYHLLKKICFDFNELNIKYIVLKGCILSYLIYDDPTIRISSDIDIYVFPEYLDLAIEYMQNNGFVLLNKNVSHHYVFQNEKSCIEIHKNILNPFTNIDEKYLKDNICNYFIQDNQIYSLSITATLIHLFYHLYMDSLLSLNHYNTIINGTVSKTKRFKYRSYEMALFVKKYNNQINWHEFNDEINSQRLNIVFKFMLLEILRTFPKIIPRFCVMSFLSKQYVNYEKNTRLNEILFALCNSFESGQGIGRYIDNNWNLHNSAVKKIGNQYIFKNSTDQFATNFIISKAGDGLLLSFEICDDDLSFSELDNFNTLQSDGIHLLICNTNSYSYNSIFLFPKCLEGEIKVFAYDCISNELIKNQYVEAFCDITSHGYNMKIQFKGKFLKENNIKEFFYLGVIISNCKKDCERRVSSLMHTELESEWYDPTHFLKIETNN